MSSSAPVATSGPRLPPLPLLIAISALGPLVLNAVLPANTAITRELDTTYSAVQMVLTVYLVAIMFAQIVLGNLADRIGRQPVMAGSLLIFSAGSVICAMAPTIELLLLGRFVQGCGAAVCLVLPRTIIRDVYPRDQAASVIGYMTTAMMLAPMFGPAAGGWVTDVSSWRYLYAGLAAVGILLAGFSALALTETLPAQTARKPATPFRYAAASLLSSGAFRAYLAIQCGSVGVYYAFLGGAPYVAMELGGLSATAYGRWFALIAVGYLLGNLTAGHFSRRFGGNRMILLSLPPLFTGVALFWLLSSWEHPLALFFPMQLVAFSNGMSLPNVMSATMSVKPDLAGSASGLAGTLQTATGIALTIVLSLWQVNNGYPLFLLMTLSVALVAWGYRLMRQPGNYLPDDLRG